jgi:hypothetical protein
MVKYLALQLRCQEAEKDFREASAEFGRKYVELADTIYAQKIGTDGKRKLLDLLRRSGECHARIMRKTALLCVAAGLLWICFLSSSAQDGGTWRAAGSTAVAITGDIAISDTKLLINFTPFTIAQIRKLDPAETGAAFDIGNGPAGTGNLYRVNVPAARRFLHHNTLCGSDETQWMATYISGRDLQVAFFSGTKMPVFTSEALANSNNLCGMFSYVR